MLDTLDPLIISRIQFAFTVSFHILFPAFTIGLASWLAVLEWRWLRTGNPIYANVYRMWVKIFAVAFGMGVVSGVVLSFQFGTNWSVFSDRAGNVLGPLLGYEVLTAFFLEASFHGGHEHRRGRFPDCRPGCSHFPGGLYLRLYVYFWRRYLLHSTSYR